MTSQTIWFRTPSYFMISLNFGIRIFISFENGLVGAGYYNAFFLVDVQGWHKELRQMLLCLLIPWNVVGNGRDRPRFNLICFSSLAYHSVSRRETDFISTSTKAIILNWFLATAQTPSGTEHEHGQCMRQFTADWPMNTEHNYHTNTTNAHQV